MNSVLTRALKQNKHSANVSLSSIHLPRSSSVFVKIPTRQFYFNHSLQHNKMPEAVHKPSTSSSSNMQPKFLVSLDPEHPNAKAPTRGSALAAGYDLYASQNVIIPKGGRIVVPTGIRVAIPEGSYGRVAPRSGLASKHGIDCGAGVIDADYRGLLGVLLFNFGDSDFSINVGDRIAQLILERIFTSQVEVVQSLTETVRGEGGFGSTGGFSAPAIIKS